MRKGKPIERIMLPDPVYNSTIVTKFINKLMISGKRGVAQNILYSAFEIIKRETNKDPLEVFEQAIKNVKPVLELKTKRIGGANYPIPIPVLEGRDLTLCLRWIVNYARSRNDGINRSMEAKLAAELIDASNGKGLSVKKKEDTHKMAEANKAFSHYRW